VTQPMWLLIMCCLLNCASRTVAQRVLSDLMTKWPAAASLANADEAELAASLRCLGFVSRRARVVRNLARAATAGESLTEQFGVGEYARRSHRIFCDGELGDDEPDDGPLKRYWRWRVSHDRGT